MSTWLYLASDARQRATLLDTLNAATSLNVVWREARNSDGATIANVKHLAIGDDLIVAFRQPTPCAYLRGRIGAPKSGVAGTVVDSVGPLHSAELQGAGYPVKGGHAEVIHLEDVQPCYFTLSRQYSQNAIQRPDARDLAAMQTAGAIPLPLPTGKRTRTPGAPKAQPAPRRAGRPVATVKRNITAASPGDRCFDAYLMIDWSAASSPARAGAADSIWFGFGQWNGNTFSAVSYEQQLTRADARTRLAALLAGWQKDQRRVLVGLDFAFGYPKGTAAALGLQGSAWKAIHDAIANSVSDNAQNTHTGAQFASDCNGRVLPAGQPGPFWGCSVRDQVPGRLEQRRVGVFAFPYGPSMLGQWRITDTRAAHRAVTQSVWKLNCGVSVGMQTIVGIKHLAEASRAIGSSARIWPFETGFSAPEKPGVWFAEIFPSIVTIDESVVSHQPLDCRQVESCVLEAAMRDCRGEMVKTLGAPSGLSQAELATVTGEEGWMLFL